MFDLYTKDVLNYMGNKFRLLNFILPEFDKNCSGFIDVFGGGGTVCVNQTCKNVVYNDYLTPLYKLMKTFYETPTEVCLDSIKQIIKEYDISKTNKEEFLHLRKIWNQKSEEDKYTFNGLMMLYVIICHSFNYQLGFNNSGEFNVAFGANRSSFNSALEKRFPEFLNKMKLKNMTFLNLSFDKLIDVLVATYKGQDLLLYLDPPYLASDDSYSRTKSVKWTRELENLLYEKCNLLNENGFKFVLSNVIENNGKTNNILAKWVEDNNYIIKYPDCDYSNCNYQKDRNSKNKEVLIKNY